MAKYGIYFRTLQVTVMYRFPSRASRRGHWSHAGQYRACGTSASLEKGMAARHCWHQPNRPAPSRDNAASISPRARHSATAWCHIALARRNAAWRASGPSASAAALTASRPSRPSSATLARCSCHRHPSSARQCGSAAGCKYRASAAGSRRSVPCRGKIPRSADIAFLPSRCPAPSRPWHPAVNTAVTASPARYKAGAAPAEGAGNHPATRANIPSWPE
jgi:hypothetical protein